MVRLWMLSATLVLATGCTARTAAPPPRISDPAAHVIWIFPGIEGGPLYIAGIRDALRKGGVEAEYREFDWQRLLGLTNLTDYEGNRQRARDVAREVAHVRRQSPHASIDFVGYSGGGGIAVFVLEELPPDVTIRSAVLVQPALSPDYDLSAALAHVNELVNLHSPHDWFILGAGTRTFGTIDRKNFDAAGRFGFDVAAIRDTALRPRLRQIPWEPEMTSAGHAGGHLGIVSSDWNTKYVAPLLQSPR
jgi:pimeloyl-ACP methyl ester carboxylesterase